MNEPKHPEPVVSTEPAPVSHSVATPPQWQSEQLLQGRKEVFIHHGDEIYRLRLTRQGKLILYK